MASLDGNSVVLEDFVSTSERFKIGIWTVKLSGEATDTFTVPGATDTNGVAVLLKGLGEDPVIPPVLSSSGLTAAQASITVAVTQVDEGNSTVTVTNGASPRRENTVIIVTKHRADMHNNLSIDEDPT